jgi:hypothetical protein
MAGKEERLGSKNFWVFVFWVIVCLLIGVSFGSVWYALGAAMLLALAYGVDNIQLLCGYHNRLKRHR